MALNGPSILIVPLQSLNTLYSFDLLRFRWSVPYCLSLLLSFVVSYTSLYNLKVFELYRHILILPQ